MFRRRDIPPVLLLLLLIVLVMLTLSQILVVHHGRYGRGGGGGGGSHNLRKLQLELRELDLNLHSLMMHNVPSIELNKRILQNQINRQRFASLLRQAQTPINASSSSSSSSSALHRPEARPDRPAEADRLRIREDKHNEGLMADTPNNRSNGNNSELSYCPSVPPRLFGRVTVDVAHVERFSEEGIMAANPALQPGGRWRPRGCVARHKVAVVVPYRDRRQHLLTLLAHLHPILQRQQLDYTLIVVEQSGSATFNKARIMNIAFVEGLKLSPFQCFVFHDVDLVPEDDRNMYSCPQQPRHMSVAIDEMGYKLAYQELVGGVLNLRSEHFHRVNGYSNLYWGWGAEDDDMAYRILHVGLKITRPPDNIARYKMIKHTKRKPSDWRKRAKLLYTGTRRFQFDGLNSLTYKVVHIKPTPLYTHILVDIGQPPPGF